MVYISTSYGPAKSSLLPTNLQVPFFFCLPSAVGENITAYVRAGNFIVQSGAISVNISCPSKTVNLTESLQNAMLSNFTRVRGLPPENGPGLMHSH